MAGPRPALVLLAALSGCAFARGTAPFPAPPVSPLPADLAPLRAHFDAASHRPRLLLLLSPS